MSDIHTIATGHLIDHTLTGECWCKPTSVPDDGRRIWTHHGHNDKHYPMYVGQSANARVLDVNGEPLPTDRLTCAGCGNLQPRGRHHSHCLGCVHGADPKAAASEVAVAKMELAKRRAQAKKKRR